MAAKTKTKPKFGFYPSYQFGDHDPIIDQIDTLRKDAGSPKFDKVSADSGVSVTTLNNWHTRKVKRPQFATVKAVVQALGGELGIVYRGKVIK